MNGFALASFAAGLLYASMGLQVLRLDLRARTNQVFFVCCLSLALWSLAYVFLYTAPDERGCWTWQRVGAVGRYAFPALVLHFCLLLTDRRRVLAWRATYVLLYLPPVVFTALAFSERVVYTSFVRGAHGWVGVIQRSSVLAPLFISFTAVFILVGTILVAAWGRRSRRPRERRQALLITATAIVTMVVNLLLDVVLPATGLARLPPMAQIVTVLWVAGIAVAINRYKLMSLSIPVASGDIVARINDVVILADTRGAITFANARAVNLLGYDAAALRGRTLDSLITSGRPTDGVLAHLTPNTPLDVEVRCQSGDTIPVCVFGTSIVDHAGEEIGSVLVLHDLRLLRQLEREIATREQALLQLRQAQEGLEARIQERTAELTRERDITRSIFDSSPDGMVLGDARGVILDCNQAALDLFGYSDTREVLGKTAFDFIVPEQHALAMANLQRVTTSGAVKDAEYTFRRRDGSELLGLVSVALIPAPTPGATTMIAIFKDISRQRRSERELAAEKERLAVTLRSIGDGVITTDTGGRVVLVNKVAEQLTGWSQAEAAGRRMDEVFAIVEAGTQRPLPSLADEVLRERRMAAPRRQALLRPRRGDPCRIEDSAAPIFDSQGEMIGVVVVFRDVTERLKSEANVMRAQKLESLGILAGGIAHDFNNILTAVIGNLSLARESSQSGHVGAVLSDAENAAARAKSLSLQLLSLSRGGAPVRKTSSMRALVTESVEFVLRGSQVGSELDIDPALWNAELDEGQITQVIHNLVLNACHAMDQRGKILVRCRNTVLDEDNAYHLPSGRYLTLAVTDHGVGIATEDLVRIFDPYFTTKKSEGHGLGLSSTYTIVRNHEGHIEVESQLGVGTTFTVYLPASLKQVTPPSFVSPVATRAGGRVLILEDDPMIVRVMERLFARLGTEVVVTRDGEETIKRYQERLAEGKPFDLVLLDLTIQGGMGGTDTIRRLREIDPDVRAVVSSGYSTDAVMSNYKEHGFMDCLMKPYRLSDLQALLIRCGIVREGG